MNTYPLDKLMMDPGIAVENCWNLWDDAPDEAEPYMMDTVFGPLQAYGWALTVGKEPTRRQQVQLSPEDPRFDTLPPGGRYQHIGHITAPIGVGSVRNQLWRSTEDNIRDTPDVQAPVAPIGIFSPLGIGFTLNAGGPGLTREPFEQNRAMPVSFYARQVGGVESHQTTFYGTILPERGSE